MFVDITEELIVKLRVLHLTNKIATTKPFTQALLSLKVYASFLRNLFKRLEPETTLFLYINNNNNKNNNKNIAGIFHLEVF